MIKMYGADWCGDCKRAEMFFNQHNINFEYIDIDKDEKAAEYVVSVNPQGNRSIPVIVSDNENILIEPSWAELEQMFAKA